MTIALIDHDNALAKIERFVPPAIRETAEFYEIRGGSEKEMRSQLSQYGVKWDDGNVYDSVTSWSVSWRYDNDDDSASCRTDTFRVVMDIHIRYPKWVRTDDAPQLLLDKWERYLTSLVRHERGHRDHAAAAATAFARSVSRLPAVMSCSDLERSARAISREVLKQLNNDAREYDVATRHGATQGAMFR